MRRSPPFVTAAVILPALMAGLILLVAGCSDHPTQPFCAGTLTREETIPQDAVKQTPEDDLYPPVVHSAAYDDPVPLPGPVNTAGSEDAPVVSRDGESLFFFWTPDSSVPPEEQLGDCVTGVWWSQRDGRGWTDPERAVLSDRASLDGPMCEQDGTLWFATFRTGTFGEGDIYTATWSGSSWSWRNAGELLNSDYDIGEVCLTAQGDTMIYARDSSHGAYGGYDLWESYRVAGVWTQPVNLGETVNSDVDDGWPYLSPGGSELWFTRNVSELGYPGPAIYRTVRTGGGWSAPEEIVSQYVGDAAMDPDGNLYFTHHFVDALGETIETDIYVCYRR